MEELNELRKREKEALNLLNQVRKRIDKLESADKLPKAKAAYEGKYFKFLNSYSLPDNEQDFWYVYYAIKEVSSPDRFKGSRFQTDKHGEITIQTADEFWLSICQTEISKEEYTEAWDKLMENIKQ